jgi:hypothetical protein
VSSYPSLPLLFAEGSHYDVGHQIGSAFKEQILTVMQSNTFFNSKMLFYNSTAGGSALYSTYYHTVASTFPKYLDELRGMADGAGLSFSKLFLWNMMFEWQTLLEPTHLPTPSCSDLYLVTEDRSVCLDAAIGRLALCFLPRLHRIGLVSHYAYTHNFLIGYLL